MADEIEIGELDITDELIAERRAEEPGKLRRYDFMATSNNRFHRCIKSMGWTNTLSASNPPYDSYGYRGFSRSMFGVLASNDMADTARALGLGPTLWSYDISRMLGGVLFMGAAGYALMRGVHIRADFIFEIGHQKHKQQ